MSVIAEGQEQGTTALQLQACLGRAVDPELDQRNPCSPTMGHSLHDHHTTYHRWLEQSDVAAVAAGLADRMQDKQISGF